MQIMLSWTAWAQLVILSIVQGFSANVSPAVLQVNELQSAVMKIGENLQKAAGGSDDGSASGSGAAGGGADGGTTYDAEAKEDKK